jgi:hypothetical protein
MRPTKGLQKRPRSPARQSAATKCGALQATACASGQMALCQLTCGTPQEPFLSAITPSISVLSLSATSCCNIQLQGLQGRRTLLMLSFRYMHTQQQQPTAIKLHACGAAC